MARKNQKKTAPITVTPMRKTVKEIKTGEKFMSPIEPGRVLTMKHSYEEQKESNGGAAPEHLVFLTLKDQLVEVHLDTVVEMCN